MSQGSYYEKLAQEALQEAYRKGEVRYRFGRLVSGGIRICGCGEVTLEDERHLCPLTDEEAKELGREE